MLRHRFSIFVATWKALIHSSLQITGCAMLINDNDLIFVSASCIHVFNVQSSHIIAAQAWKSFFMKALGIVLAQVCWQGL